MNYFDYSATTPVNKEVLEEFINYFIKNSQPTDFSHEKEEIQTILKINHDVIFTSGATESNNYAISGILNKYSPKEKKYHILTTKLEHSSVLNTLNYYEKQGFVIDYVPLENGIVTIENLEKQITKDTILISIASVSSELGILQPIDEIGKYLKKYQDIIFHSDMTQSIGKVAIPLDNVDLITFTPHKFYGIKGIGCLLKKPTVQLEPIFYGERIFSYPLIRSMIKALTIAIENQSTNFKLVQKKSDILLSFLKNYDRIKINHPKTAIPHIINMSIFQKPEMFQHALEQEQIFVSTRSACSSKEDYSMAVLEYTNDFESSKTSLRISISHLTTDEELKRFMEGFHKCYESYIN